MRTQDGIISSCTPRRRRRIYQKCFTVSRRFGKRLRAVEDMPADTPFHAAAYNLYFVRIVADSKEIGSPGRLRSDICGIIRRAGAVFNLQPGAGVYRRAARFVKREINSIYPGRDLERRYPRTCDRLA